MNHSDLFRLKQLIDKINREALIQILENETLEKPLENNSVLTNIAECSLEAKEIINAELENARN